MNANDVSSCEKDNVCYITIKNVRNENDRTRIRALVSAFLGVQNEYSDWFDDIGEVDDTESTEENLIGTLNIVPEGKFIGHTVQDVYCLYGHESLVALLLQINKMTSIDQTKKNDLYRETVQFAIPVIRRKEVDLEGFAEAYAPFLVRKIDGVIGTVEDWLKQPEDRQDEIYDTIIDSIIERMEASLEKLT